MRLNSQPLLLHTSEQTVSTILTVFCSFLCQIIFGIMMSGAVRRLQVRCLMVLCLGTLHGCSNCEAAPNPSSPLQGSSWGNPRRYVHLRASTELNNFYLEISLTGHVRKTTHRGSYSECAFIYSVLNKLPLNVLLLNAPFCFVQNLCLTYSHHFNRCDVAESRKPGPDCNIWSEK